MSGFGENESMFEEGRKEVGFLFSEAKVGSEKEEGCCLFSSSIILAMISSLINRPIGM